MKKMEVNERVDQKLLDWLLQAETPTIRYCTLVDLLGRPADDPEVISAKRAIMEKGPVPHILAAQKADGQWAYIDNYYQPKYVSTHWSLLLLSELGVDSDDSRFQQGVDYMLRRATDEIQQRQVDSKFKLACLWGNSLRYALHAGRLHDGHTKIIIKYLLDDLQDGFCTCPHNTGLSCAWGVIRTLYGLAAIPPAERSMAITVAIEQALDFVLNQFALVDASYPIPDNGKIHPLWFKLNFPLFYQTDILITLRVLAELDALDEPGAQPARRWLAKQRLKNGRFRGRNPYGSRTWPLGGQTEISRWISLFAVQLVPRIHSEENAA